MIWQKNNKIQKSKFIEKLEEIYNISEEIIGDGSLHGVEFISCRLLVEKWMNVI